MNYLQTKISGYYNVGDRRGFETTLEQFLKSEKQKLNIELIRKENSEDKQKQLKKDLPCATISGVFDYPRSDETLLKHSGLICIDIDEKDNPSYVGRWESLKTDIGHLKDVLYCGLSVRGNGLFVIIPISEPSKHREHFRALERAFKTFGIVVDTSCVNESRLRYVSYDPHPYINENATVYTKTYTEPKQIYSQTIVSTYNNDDLLPLDICVEKCESHNIDITSDNAEWFKVGSALSNGLGEQGRAYFHRLSSLYPKYRESETDEKYNHCLRLGKTSFKWLFRHFADYGITYSEDIKERRRSEHNTTDEPVKVLTQKEKDLQTMEKRNPALTQLINAFDLV